MLRIRSWTPFLRKRRLFRYYELECPLTESWRCDGCWHGKSYLKKNRTCREKFCEKRKLVLSSSGIPTQTLRRFQGILRPWPYVLDLWCMLLLPRLSGSCIKGILRPRSCRDRKTKFLGVFMENPLRSCRSASVSVMIILCNFRRQYMDLFTPPESSGSHSLNAS